MKQAIHLSPGRKVFAYLAHHAFLGIGQFERQSLIKKAAELFAHTFEDKAGTLEFLLSVVAEDVELQVKEFFELEPPRGFGKCSG